MIQQRKELNNNGNGWHGKLKNERMKTAQKVSRCLFAADGSSSTARSKKDNGLRMEKVPKVP